MCYILQHDWSVLLLVYAALYAYEALYTLNFLW